MDDISNFPMASPPAQVVAQEAPTATVITVAKKSGPKTIEEKRQDDNEPPAILPDDLRKEVRPEDLLPFFQFPRGGATIGVGVPVPSQAPAPVMPQSSATYRQQ
jgi:hypothetical protein